MADFTTANDLRQYADWVEQHPEIDTPGGRISIYSTKADQALVLLKNGAKLDLIGVGDTISYVTQKFGSLTIRHVVNKDELMEPAIVEGKVTWALRPEFAFAEVR